MWYYEQADHFGAWHPRSTTRNPEERTLGPRRKIRQVTRVSGIHEELTLDELRAIYGTPAEAPADA